MYVAILWYFSLADPGGGAHLACTPLRDPILSFRHTNFMKCSRLGSPRPPLRGPRPPTGNPGSATASDSFWLCLNYFSELKNSKAIMNNLVNSLASNACKTSLSQYIY